MKCIAQMEAATDLFIYLFIYFYFILFFFLGGGIFS